MGGKSSLQKGKRGEREVVKILQPVVDEMYSMAGLEVPKLQRNTLQSDSGGYDIVGLSWIALEVKLQEQQNLNGWWKQTLTQAGPNQLPVLFYRKNHAKWRVRTWGNLAWGSRYANHILVDISVEDFLNYFRLILKSELSDES
jgi:hypothetical protein